MAARGGTVAARMDSTGQVTDKPAILSGVYHLAGNSEGQIVIKNGDTNGDVQFDMATAASNRGQQVIIPNGGVRCPDGIHLDTLVNVDSCIIFWETE